MILFLSPPIPESCLSSTLPYLFSSHHALSPCYILFFPTSQLAFQHIFFSCMNYVLHFLKENEVAASYIFKLQKQAAWKIPVWSQVTEWSSFPTRLRNSELHQISLNGAYYCLKPWHGEVIRRVKSHVTCDTLKLNC